MYSAFPSVCVHLLLLLLFASLLSFRASLSPPAFLPKKRTLNLLLPHTQAHTTLSFSLAFHPSANGLHLCWYYVTRLPFLFRNIDIFNDCSNIFALSFLPFFLAPSLSVSVPRSIFMLFEQFSIWKNFFVFFSLIAAEKNEPNFYTSSSEK